MATRRFAHFEYKITDTNPSLGSAVEVTFDFKGYHITRYVIIDNGHLLNKSQVIELAKQRIDSEIKEGILEQYSNNFIKSKLKVSEEVIDKSLKPRKNKKKLVTGVVIGGLAIAASGLTAGLVILLNKKPLYDLSFVGKHCTVNYAGEDVYQFNDKFEYGKKIELDLRQEESFEMPSKITVQGIKDEDCIYNPENGKIIIPSLNGNVSIVAEATQDCTIFIDANGGYFKGEGKPTTFAYKVDPGTYLVDSLKTEQEQGRLDIVKPVWAKDNIDPYFEIFNISDNVWDRVDPNDVVENNIYLRVQYEAKTLNLNFTGGGNTDTDQPITFTINGVVPGTTLGELRNDPSHKDDFESIEDADYKEGYRFYHWCTKTISPTESYTDVDDNFIINGADGQELNFEVRCEVKVTFDDGEGFGTPHHKEGWFPERDTWENYSVEYGTDIHNPLQKKFDSYASTNTGSNVGDTYVFNKPDTFTANYVCAGNFQYDTWDDFKQNIIDFYDSSKERSENPYIDEYQSDEGKEANTFVGLTRTVEANGKIYNVTVVDEADDDQSNITEVESHGNYLAFQFDEIINLSDIEFFSGDIDPDVGVSYANGDLDNFVSNDLPNYFDQEFVGSVSEASLSADVNRKFYIASADELGYTYNETTASDDYSGAWENEGVPFKSYSGESISASDRAKKKNGDEYKYWTRSVDTSSPIYCWFIDEDGNLGQYDDDDEVYYSEMATTKLGVAPIFEIGGID